MRVIFFFSILVLFSCKDKPQTDTFQEEEILSTKEAPKSINDSANGEVDKNSIKDEPIGISGNISNLSTDEIRAELRSINLKVGKVRKLPERAEFVKSRTALRKKIKSSGGNTSLIADLKKEIKVLNKSIANFDKTNGVDDLLSRHKVLKKALKAKYIN